MSKKLLEEAAVRKFMKIAGLQPLTNTFLKESEDSKEVKQEAKKDDGEKLEEVEDLEEGKDDLEEGYGKKDGKKDDKKDKMEESKEELEEGGGQMPFDSSSRRVDERAPEDRMDEAKALSGSVKGKGAKGSQKFKTGKIKHKNGSSGKPLNEEDMPEDDMGDVEVAGGDDMGAEEAPEADPATQAAVEKLLGAVAKALEDATGMKISMEKEADETEVEMGAEEGGMESGEGEGQEGGGDEALDEATLENVVAETVKRVKARLSEGVSKSKKRPLTKEALARKVAARVAERLKKR